MDPVASQVIRFGNIVRLVWQDFSQAWRVLIAYEVLFKLVEAWLLVPAVALVLSTILARAGHFVVSNHEILDFAFTPLGVLYAAILGTVAIASRLIEQAGIMLVTAHAVDGGTLTLSRLLRVVFLKTLSVAKLGATKTALLTFTWFPFVLLAALTYSALLTNHDIYFYWTDRPPIFWLSVGIGIALLTGALAVGMWLYVRWAFALPILLFERKLANRALRASRERVRSVFWRVGGWLLSWQLMSLVFAACTSAAYHTFAASILGTTQESSSWLILLLLVGQAVLLGMVSFVTVVGQGLLTRRLYLLRSRQLGDLPLEPEQSVTEVAEQVSPLILRAAYAALAVVLLSPCLIWFGLTQTARTTAWVQVTAHRGHARAAPENTLAAIRKAIDSGADYAEIDVQQTADGRVVLLHDRDLMRVAGDSRRLAELSFAELRTLDVGSWFAPSFAAERVPTLEEVIEVAKGRIKLNIELKLYGPDKGLAQEVARIVAAQEFTANVLITSFSYEALLSARQENPQQRTGLIIAHSLGDISRLEVEALSVRADHLSDNMLRSAHRLGREVHVWTVNDREQISRWIKRGVDNIITSDPDLAIEVRSEWANLSEAEKLLRSSRLLLGI